MIGGTALDREIGTQRDPKEKNSDSGIRGNFMDTVSGSSGRRVHRLYNPTSHAYKVKNTVTPQVRLNFSKKRRKSYANKRHLSF